MQLNVWRPSNGVWYRGVSLAGMGGSAFAFGTYGDIPFAPDMEGDGDGGPVVFRPSTGTWYGLEPPFAITWGQPGAPERRMREALPAACGSRYRLPHKIDGCPRTIRHVLTGGKHAPAFVLAS